MFAESRGAGSGLKSHRLVYCIKRSLALMIAYGEDSPCECSLGVGL